MYENSHFVSSYKISEEAFKEFKKTGNIGLSPEERAQKINQFQKMQAKLERKENVLVMNGDFGVPTNIDAVLYFYEKIYLLFSIKSIVKPDHEIH